MVSVEPVSGSGRCRAEGYSRAVENILVSMLKNQLLAVPVIRRNRAAHPAPDVPGKNGVAYVQDVFENSSRRISGRRPLSGSVMEIGPGGNLGVLLMYLAAGCERGVAFDLAPLVTDQQDLYGALTPDAAELLARIEYRTGEPIEKSSLPDGDFDIIFSAACLEHVADPVAALKAIHRLLKPGGVTTHSVDLRDHRDFDDPLAFLKHSDRIWRAATSRRVPTNRWRASDWQRGFEDAGFVDVTIEPHEKATVTEETRSRFHRNFQAKDLVDLSTLVINVTATKSR